MSEHPVLIPTSLGPAGGIVCEPGAPSRAAVLLLHTGGRSGRSGFSSEWALLSRRLAALGATVLRYDFCFEGDSPALAASRDLVDASIEAKFATDMTLLRDVAAWFRKRTEELDLVVVGACYGGRLGLELAAELPAVSALLLVVPFLRRLDEGSKARWRQRREDAHDGKAPEQLDRADPIPGERLDPLSVQAFERALDHGPCWVLIGEHDPDEALALPPEIGKRDLEVDVAPGAALYPGNEPDVQELVADSVVARFSRLLAVPTSG